MSPRSSLTVALTTPTLLLLLASCQATPSEQAAGAQETAHPAPAVEYLTTPEMESMGFPFSEAVRVGNMLYLSGQAGNLPDATSVVEGGIQAETRQAMENIRAALERYGSSMDRVVKCTVMIDT